MKHLIVTVVVAVMLAPGCTREATKGEAMKSSESPGRKPPAGKNRLAFEKSPYLLQHADNPVDWYPWGDEAFTAAREQGKPIFLSIGYSTCHWCHVMEHESFEDPQVAALMNDAFVCIKVDREERPDIDGIYMTVCQMMTQRGGWPLTILMTADRKPFFAGTYLPRETMLTFVPRVKNLWLTEREKIVAEADRVTGILRQSVASSAGDALGVPELDLAYTQLSSRFDSTWGGFGDQPKFPTPHNLLFLLRYGQRSGDARALQMVERTLTMMRRGGVYDHVGFGFHRYSTDARWFLPHFEKMLYDQALLVMCYAEAWQATGKPEYRKTAEEVIAYVLRDMTDAGGGFYSAEDADSEGEEGKFYLWTEAELRGLLGADAEGFAAAYGVTAGGNYAEEASGEHKGTSILYQPRSVGETAKARKMDGRTLEASLESSRRVLFDVREKRVHPYKDDKILADWNGLMIAALAEAGRIFDSKEYVAAAERAATFVLSSMKNKDGGIYHRFRDGESSIDGMLDDYAMMVWGLIELYQATFRTEYLERAIAYSNLALDRFWDDTGGAFYFAEAGGADLIVRQKESYDGAVPSGNSVSMLNLVRLGRITAKPEWEQRARDIGRAFHSQVSRAPSAYTQMMIAVDFQAGPSFEVVVAGREDAEDTRAMMRALETKYAPRRVVVFRPEGNADAVIRLAPYTKAQTAIEGRATAYVCRNYACELPTVDPLQMQRLMASP